MLPVDDTGIVRESYRYHTAKPMQTTNIKSEAIDTVAAGSKPPWRPKVAGYIALLLGPVAGALVAAASFRRMGQPRKARQTLLYTLLLTAAFLIPFLLAIPADAGVKKIILLAVEGAGYSVFPSLVREEYVKWRAANPDTKPRNDYASIGWGIAGLLTYLSMAVLIDVFRLFR